MGLHDEQYTKQGNRDCIIRSNLRIVDYIVSYNIIKKDKYTIFLDM